MGLASGLPLFFLSWFFKTCFPVCSTVCPGTHSVEKTGLPSAGLAAVPIVHKVGLPSTTGSYPLQLVCNDLA